jgi:hypothetical protein
MLAFSLMLRLCGGSLPEFKNWRWRFEAGGDVCDGGYRAGRLQDSRGTAGH